MALLQRYAELNFTPVGDQQDIVIIKQHHEHHRKQLVT